MLMLNCFLHHYCNADCWEVRKWMRVRRLDGSSRSESRQQKKHVSQIKPLLARFEIHVWSKLGTAISYLLAMCMKVTLVMHIGHSVTFKLTVLMTGRDQTSKIPNFSLIGVVMHRNLTLTVLVFSCMTVVCAWLGLKHVSITTLGSSLFPFI